MNRVVPSSGGLVLCLGHVLEFARLVDRAFLPSIAVGLVLSLAWRFIQVGRARTLFQWIGSLQPTYGYPRMDYISIEGPMIAAICARESTRSSRRIEMRTTLIIVTLVLAVGVAGAGELQYVVTDLAALWPDASTAYIWRKALPTEYPPEVHRLPLGTQVELLDAQECRPLVDVRVLTGPVADTTGCVSGRRLSSHQPANER
jgi:hypothetical protein